jgi:hypothetical protein
MKLLDAVTTTATGPWIKVRADHPQLPYRTFQGAVVGTGSVSATILIEVCNDQSMGALPLGTITLSGTTSATDGLATQATWNWVRARVSAVSGTSATVSVVMGV